MVEFTDITYAPTAYQDANNLQKELSTRLLNLQEVEGTERPSQFDLFKGDSNWGFNSYSSFNYIDLLTLFWAWRLSDTCMTIGHALTRKVFKGGFDVKPKIELASPTQERLIKEFIKHANSDGESLLVVMKECYDDINWADKFVMLKIKTYGLNASNEITGSRLKGIVRINPIYFTEIRDKKNRLGYIFESGKPAYVSISNRRKLVPEEIDKKTGLPNIRAHYKVTGADGFYYYNQNEVIYKNKFKKDGFSPLFSLYNKIVSLIEMDFYIRKEYSEGKPSKKMLIFKVPDREKMNESYQDYDLKMKQNPHRVHPLVMQTQGDSNSVAEVVDFMRPLKEMEFTEMRQTFYTQIGAPYGVSPVFMNDMSTGGGLNNEGLQVTVTNEAVEGDKDLMMDVLDELFDELGIFDYDVKLFPSEEEDLVWKEDLFSKQLDNAEKFLNMNGEVRFEDGEFQYKEVRLEKAEQPDPSNLEEEQDNMPTSPAENVKKSSELIGDEFMSSSDLSKPFAGFKNFRACILENQDKAEPESFCKNIMRECDDEHNKSTVMKLDNPKTFPKKSALDVTFNDFQKEYESLVKEVIKSVK